MFKPKNSNNPESKLSNSLWQSTSPDLSKAPERASLVIMAHKEGYKFNSQNIKKGKNALTKIISEISEDVEEGIPLGKALPGIRSDAEIEQEEVDFMLGMLRNFNALNRENGKIMPYQIED